MSPLSNLSFLSLVSLLLGSIALNGLVVDASAVEWEGTGTGMETGVGAAEPTGKLISRAVRLGKRQGAPISDELFERVHEKTMAMKRRNAKLLSIHSYNTQYGKIDPLKGVKSAAREMEASYISSSTFTSSSSDPGSDSESEADRVLRRDASYLQQGKLLNSASSQPQSRSPHQEQSQQQHQPKREEKEIQSHDNQKRATNPSTATLSMTDYYAGVDITYIGNVSIGTPGQMIGLLPDTGSADLWVISSGTTTSHVTYQSTSSSTFQSNSTLFSEQYGSGSVSGTAANDTVTISNLSVPNQAIGLVNEVDSAIEQSAFDGLMGLGFSTISELGAYTFFENAIVNGELTQPVFSVYLSRGDDYMGGNTYGYLNNGASLMFGGVLTPPVAVTDTSITYTPVLVEGYWEVACGGITINGATMANTQFYAAIDTGTSLIYLPTTIASAFYARYGGVYLGSGQYGLPASNITSLPTIGLSFGGNSFQINFNDFALEYTDSTKRYVLGAIIGANQNDPAGNRVAVIGDAFLKNTLTVFSYSTGNNVSVGFASLSTSKANSTVIAAPEVSSGTGGVSTSFGIFSSTATSGGSTSTSIGLSSRRLTSTTSGLPAATSSTKSGAGMIVEGGWGLMVKGMGGLGCALLGGLLIV